MLKKTIPFIVIFALLGGILVYTYCSRPKAEVTIINTQSEEKSDVIFSDDGTCAYIHGVWGYGVNSVERSTPLEQEPICGVRTAERNDKVKKITIGKLARIVETESDQCEADKPELFSEFPNLKEITIEEGNPYLKVKDNKLYEIDSSSGNERQVLYEINNRGE